MKKIDVKDLISKGLVHAKTYKEGEFAGLSVLKYSRKVFYDNLWNEDPRLLECRGMVVDQEGNIILHPFTKIFNRGENDTDLPQDKVVIAVQKKNGFMAGATRYKDGWIVSTTGTLDSFHAQLARQVIDFESVVDTYGILDGFDLLFEICDRMDPHIINEKPGAYLIGARDKMSGKMVSEGMLDSLSKLHLHWKRPIWWGGKFSQVVNYARICHHEGYVVRSLFTNELLLKIKSPYYLTKKFFMRGGVKKCAMIWSSGTDSVKKIIDEEYYPLLEYLRSEYTADQWQGLVEQDRREIIENFLEGANNG